MFPAEILDYVFSFLQKEPATLKSCSDAHPHLSSLAERHLFAHIIVYFYNSKHGFLVSQLSRCLCERPYLANHIQSITIDFDRSNGYFEDLPTILLSIPRGEELCLRNGEWSVLPETLRSALSQYLRTPHLKRIHLKDTNGFPLAILDGARNIKSLKVNSSRCRIKHPSLTLNSLESLFLQVIDFDEWTGSKFPNLSPIFNACLESLRSLTLDIGPSFRTIYLRGKSSTPICPLDSDGFLFNLSVLARLEVLSLYAIILARVEGTNETAFYTCISSLPAIAQLVRTAGPSLNRLVLNLRCEVRRALDLRDVVEWKPLVSLCDSLPRLRVDLCIRASPLSFVETFDSLVGNEDLSRLVEQGSLVLKPLFLPDF